MKDTLLKDYRRKYENLHICGMKHCKHKDNCKFPKCNCSTEKTAGI